MHQKEKSFRVQDFFIETDLKINISDESSLNYREINRNVKKIMSVIILYYLLL